MTWYVVIDEAGELGYDTRHFIMSAIITKNARVLKPIFKTIPHHDDEPKFSNSIDEEIVAILEKLSSTDASIVSLVVDKYDYTSDYYRIHGNDLYRKVLSDLLDNAFKFIGQHDVSVLIDRSTFVSLVELRSIASNSSKKFGCNLKRCEKVSSDQNKCIQIADYVAGSFFVDSEHGNDMFITTIRLKIIPAYRY